MLTLALLAALTAHPAETATTPAAVCQDTPESICVDRGDMAVFLSLAQEKYCQIHEPPVFELDPIVIITDSDGRVFFSGGAPKPYRLKMSWCRTDVVADGSVNVVAAVQTPETWGFRFRPKAYLGYLPLNLLTDEPANRGIDAGLMVDVFHYEWINLNVAAGFRSLGLGLGFDLTSNFGAYAGYAFSWDFFQGGPPHNVLTGLYFAF